MGLFEGRESKKTWRKAKWNVSAGLKQLKIAKRKVELGQFYLEMHRQTASEMASLPWSQNKPERKRSSYKGKYALTGKFLKLLHVSS